jgi:hypothetical protein
VGRLPVYKKNQGQTSEAPTDTLAQDREKIIEQRTQEQRTQEQRTQEQRTQEQRTQEQRTQEQRTQEQRTQEQRTQVRGEEAQHGSVRGEKGNLPVVSRQHIAYCFLHSLT